METNNRLQRDWDIGGRSIPDKTEVQIAANAYIETKTVQYGNLSSWEIGAIYSSFIAGWQAKEEQGNWTDDQVITMLMSFAVGYQPTKVGIDIKAGNWLTEYKQKHSK